MDINKSPEVWHRLDNESERAHEAFKIFMYLPPAERSVAAAYREWSGNTDAVNPVPSFKKWSSRFAWSDRARAHDHRLEVIREEGMEEAVREEAARQARQVEQMRGRFYELVALTFERAITYLEDDSFVEQLRPADVVHILRVHLETIQKLGDPASQAADSGVDWSEDEQRELDRIVGEIESEETQEEPEWGSDEGEEGPENAKDDQG